MQRRESGFTIVELLIVVVVIAILAAITIVSYNGITNQANNSAVMADLKALGAKIEAWKIDNNEVYPGGAGGGNLSELGFRASKGAYAVAGMTENNIWYCRNSDRTMYGVVALSRSGAIYYISDKNASPMLYSGGAAWNPSGINCNTIVSSSLGWQYAGYASSDTSSGPWRAWAGGN